MRNESYKLMMVISIIIIFILLSCATTHQKAATYNGQRAANVLKGQSDQAISDFSKAIEIDPRNAGTLPYRTTCA